VFAAPAEPDPLATLDPEPETGSLFRGAVTAERLAANPPVTSTGKPIGKLTCHFPDNTMKNLWIALRWAGQET
jgi:hypothetical protein